MYYIYDAYVPIYIYIYMCVCNQIHVYIYITNGLPYIKHMYVHSQQMHKSDGWKSETQLQANICYSMQIKPYSLAFQYLWDR